MPIAPYKIVLPGRALRIPMIAHIPHSQTLISPYIRQQILLDDDALQRELLRMTDWHTDHLFSWVLDIGGTMFVYPLSRLVMDPERFADDAQEPMAKIGHGVVYTHTSDGRPLARLSAVQRAERISELYEPYHEGLNALAKHMLDVTGLCIFLDCHSFSTTPLPHERDQRSNRPDICLGTDRFHTPPLIAKELERGFVAEGFRVRRNRPFKGTLVPSDYRKKERHVCAAMIEVRRGLYCDEATGERLPDFDDVRDVLRRVIGRVLGPPES
jgi:N-formylglutamate amidohydrolase